MRQKEAFMISIEEFNAILHEPDQDKRNARIDALSEEEAKYVIKFIMDFFNR